MKVIFIKDLKNQGKKGEVKEVKDGYGMNFLIKNGYAIRATDGSIQKLQIQNEQTALEEHLLIQEKLLEKEQLEKEQLTFSVKTGKDGKVFGTITTKQIKTKLEQLGYQIDKKAIHLDHVIASLGVHNVELELHKKVIATIKIHVIAN
ncbi:MAG: 50S ribosomal protein L9 [Bacilli bacterium]|jgi:large subunit ribosomal protein L9|nr:50S ribosomal protein L9 [Bacilli bacterium]